MTTTGKATAKKTASKKTASKSATAPKAAAHKTADKAADKNKATDASKSTSGKSTSSKSNLSTPIETIVSTLTENTQKFVGQVRDEATKAENLATKMTSEMNARIESAMFDAMGAARDFTYTAVGAPFAFQAAVTSGELADKALYVNFFNDAKVAGEAHLSDLQAKVDPYVKQIAERVEPMVEQFESMLPTQVQEAIATNRDRMRKLVNA